MNTTGLYIDFPFCLARCAFCAFNIQGYREGFSKRYIAALQKELALHAEAPSARERTITSVYLGGGTPSLYPPSVLCDLLSLIRTRFCVAADVEVTLEAHPATVDLERLTALRAGGVNRLSIGAQSFSDEHLKALGRGHTAEATRAAFHAARSAGFSNIALDLMFALPGQSSADWEGTLRSGIDLAPEHLSLYGLSIEAGTLFHKRERAGALSLPSEEEAIAFYQTAQTLLLAAGYLQYEISNFARPGYPCRHNLLYWDRGAVLGAGLSAHSYLNREHRANTDALPTYIDSIESGRRPTDQIEKISEETARRDQIIFGLRKSEGIPDHLLEGDSALLETAERLMEAGLLIQGGERTRLTSKGMLLADEVAIAFVCASI